MSVAVSSVVTFAVTAMDTYATHAVRQWTPTPSPSHSVAGLELGVLCIALETDSLLGSYGIHARNYPPRPRVQTGLILIMLP
jgi:hypothetical protein